MNRLIFIGLLMLSCTRADAFFGGGKSLGMGLAGTAYTQDSLDTSMNPAGWAKIDDRIDIGAYGLYDNGKVKIRNNFNPFALDPFANNGDYKSTHTPWTGGGSLGVRKQVTNSISAGIAIYSNTYSKTTFKRAIPVYGTSNLGLELRNLIVEPGVAMDLGCLNVGCYTLGHHYIGVNARCVFQRFKLNGLQSFQSPLLSSSPGNVTNRNYNYSMGATAVIGWLTEINDYVSVGASFQPRISMSKTKRYKGIIADKGNINVPQQASVGILVTPLCGLHVAFDVTYIWTKNVPIFTNPFFPNVFTSLAGTKSGLGFGLRNQTLYRVGADYSFNDAFTVRAGYVYGTKTTAGVNSAMSDVLLTNYYRNVLTFGATYKPNCNYEVNAFINYGFKISNKADNSIPFLFGSGDIKYDTQRTYFGVSFTWFL